MFFGVKVKVGHGGTLDPLAEGVLVLGVGSATTQLAGYLQGPKSYGAVGLLGKATDTLDSTGKVDCLWMTSIDHVACV